MAEEILINVTPKEVRVALLENGTLQEVHIERRQHQGLLGNIYKGKINRLLPGIQAAFVNIGLDRAAFLHLKDIQLKNFSAKNNPIAASNEQEWIEIDEVLQAGQEILVQVYKNPLGSKGARLTTQFTIASRFLVLTPGNKNITVSQRITDELERNRLQAILQPEEECGYIFRTAAVGATEAEIVEDKKFLKTLWAEVITTAARTKPGKIVYEDIPIVLRVLRDLVSYQIEKIRVDNKEATKQMREFAERYVPALMNKIEYYSNEKPIFDLYAVEDEIQKALQRKVYLKSGGYLVFDQTEAMTTIDVNTGSYLGHGKKEETIFKTNLEAVEVIARQIRLRNLGGMIIIDFIDMADPSHQAHLLKLLSSTLAKDNAKTEISEFSNLGLVQMTRKRTRESLEHILCITCPLCQRRGSVKSLQTICYEIFRELKRIAENYSWSGFLILASSKVVNCLLEEESNMMAELEAKLAKPIKLQIESNYTQEQYDILPMSNKN